MTDPPLPDLRKALDLYEEFAKLAKDCRTIFWGPSATETADADVMGRAGLHSPGRPAMSAVGDALALLERLEEAVRAGSREVFVGPMNGQGEERAAGIEAIVARDPRMLPREVAARHSCTEGASTTFTLDLAPHRRSYQGTCPLCGTVVEQSLDGKVERVISGPKRQ